ncbi:MAG: T9SS type A sorting domain-containing protein [Cytophagaceae bacterium]
MKKLLLSVIFAISLASLHAQTTVAIYGGGVNNPNDAVNSGDGFKPWDGAPSGFVGEEVIDNGNTYLKMAGSSDSYFVWGVNNGKYGETGSAESFGYSGAASGYLALRIKAANEFSNIKFGMITTDGKTFGKALTLSEVPGATTNWVEVHIPFSSFVQENQSGNPIGGAPTAAELAEVAQMNLILLVNSCQWDNVNNTCINVSRYAEVWVDDIHMTESQLNPIPVIIVTSSKNVTAVISDTKLYPNPASEITKVELTLKSASDVKISVSDMTGKVVAEVTSANTTSVFEVINVSNLAKGTYTVNYYINGAPAKTELLMVK